MHGETSECGIRGNKQRHLKTEERRHPFKYKPQNNNSNVKFSAFSTVYVQKSGNKKSAPYRA